MFKYTKMGFFFF